MLCHCLPSCHGLPRGPPTQAVARAGPAWLPGTGESGVGWGGPSRSGPLRRRENFSFHVLREDPGRFSCSSLGLPEHSTAPPAFPFVCCCAGGDSIGKRPGRMACLVQFPRQTCWFVAEEPDSSPGTPQSQPRFSGDEFSSTRFHLCPSWTLKGRHLSSRMALLGSHLTAPGTEGSGGSDQCGCPPPHHGPRLPGSSPAAAQSPARQPPVWPPVCLVSLEGSPVSPGWPRDRHHSGSLLSTSEMQVSNWTGKKGV